jgi:phage repressor protein C with HTH and peptisase S24 domain
MTSFSQRILMLTDKFGIDSIVENSTISKTQLYRLRSGDQDTSRKNVVLIQRATGCNLQWLVTGDGPMMPGDAEPLVNEPEFTNDEIEMIELFRKAPLMLKMQTIQMLSTGQAPQSGGVTITGDGNQNAGRDIK